MENMSAEDLKRLISSNLFGERVLNLSGKQLSKVPDTLTELTEVEVLDLSENHLTELPTSINKLKKLKKLKLDNNQLRELPDTLCELSNLTKVNAGNNQLWGLPTNITDLKKLGRLELSSNQLASLPDDIGKLEELWRLDVSNNQLSVLPKSIKHLKKLRGLGLSNNQLMSLPDGICELVKLVVLDVDHNQLSVLPRNFKHLKNLWRLDLSKNQLASLCDVGELEALDSNSLLRSSHIKHLKKLNWLDLSNNHLKSLPDDIGELVKLRWLYVRNNQLSVLPCNIKHLKKLQWLDLSNNELTTLPDDISDLKELEVLEVDGNPLTFKEMRRVVKLQKKMKYSTDTAGHVCEQRAEGQRAQQAYEKALKDGYVKVYRGRILFIGPERAGKTSLKKSLLGLPFDPKEQSTEGIEVNPSECQIEVEQVKDWHSTHENKPGLLEFSKDVARMVAEKLCKPKTVESKKGQMSTEGVETKMAKEEHFKEEEGELFKDMAFKNSDRKVVDFKIEEGTLSNKNQVGENVDLVNKLDISLPSRKATLLTKEVNNDAHDFPHFRSGKGTLEESDVMINATLPPDDITKHVHQWLKYARGERVKRDITKEESAVSMDVWDFAGQHLYYATHPVFLSSRAIYILVHNLSKSLNAPAQPCVRQGTHDIHLDNSNDETNVENLLSWLATIRSISRVKEETCTDAQRKLSYLRPPVFIVGTHADKPFEDIAVMKSQIQKRISGIEYEKHVVRPFFSIDNTRSQQTSWIKKFFRQGPKGRSHQAGQEGNTDEIQALRNRIMEVLREEPYMGEKVPVRWFLFEKVIEALIAKQIYYRDMDQLQDYAKKECFIEDADEFAAMISFYHGLGMIIKHRSTVVLDAQWLIDLFKQLITIPHFDRMDPVHCQYWLELERDGILSMEHVDYAFSKFIQQGVIKDDILDMMERFGLIAKFSTSPTDVKYFVPAQLKSSPEEVCKIEPSHTDPCPLYLHFVHGFVPHGLFSQLVSRSIHWCCKAWPTRHPKLYQNGAWFVIGKQIHDFILICKKNFVKIVVKQRAQSHQISRKESEELALLVRGFVEVTLQNLSQELGNLSGLQYKLCVACPYCHQRTDQVGEECSTHGKLSCLDEECFHLLEINKGQPLICMKKVCDEVREVHGLEKWFLKRTDEDCRPFTTVGTSHGAQVQEVPMKSDTAFRVTLLASEWSSSMGGLSTINRQLSILLSRHEQVEVTLLVPQSACSEEEKRAARSHNITIREAERRPGYNDPLDWLSFPPRDLAIDIVLGHGGKLGKQAQVIRESHSCQWVQVVHTAPEELGMHKNYQKAISKGEEKNRTEVDLCKLADLVVAVGPKLTETYSSFLRAFEKHQQIIQLTPGIFSEFSDVKQAPNESDKFKVLTFGRGDPEDFSLKGYDIAAKAIVELKDSSYHLIFVGAPDERQEEVGEHLLKSGISKRQLTVRKFVQSMERLKELFCEVDLAIMPSRTEGFGLTALEALSASLPILVSGNSGFGDALRTIPSGELFVVDSEEPEEWAKAIAGVRQKDRAARLKEIQRLRACYEDRFSWEKQCNVLVDQMWNLVHDSVESAARQMTSEALPSCDLLGKMFQNLQQMQHDAGKVKPKTDLTVELEKIVSDKGFVISDNQGSGNCMFYALSEQLDLVKGIKILHEELRQSVVNYLRKNARLPDGTHLFNFVDGYRSWDDYLANMEQDGAWGDHVILYAAANCYDTCIHVISGLPHHGDLTIRPDRHVDSTNPLVLGHVHEVHYVSLQPKKANHRAAIQPVEVVSQNIVT